MASKSCSTNAENNTKLQSVPDVDIDNQGRFKYILIKVHDLDVNEDFKYIVRGTVKAPFHADIYELVASNIDKKGLECEVMGGGRIEHDPANKSIKVYGYSQGYGLADHSITQSILLKKYQDYHSITWSNEGY